MALAGMVFACTGKTSQTRAQLTKKIKDNGGTFAATLTKKVTHLLCGEGYEGTEKYEKAKASDSVHVVNEGFLDACLKNKKKKPNEADYPVGEEGSGEEKEESKDGSEEGGSGEEKEESKEEEGSGEEKASGEESKEEEEGSGEEKASNEESKEEGSGEENAESSKEEGSKVEEMDEEAKSSKEEEEGEGSANEGSEEEGEKQKKKKKAPSTPRKKHEAREAKDHALKGWVVLLGTRIGTPKDQIVDYIEKHGGSVTGSANLATHVLGEVTSKQARSATEQGKAVAVDEEYMRSVVKDYKEEGGDEAVTASQTPVKPSPLKTKKGRGKAKVIERIVSRKLYRGKPHFLVQYVGLNDSHNELLTEEDAIAAGGKKALQAFNQTFKKELKLLDYNVYMATEIEETTDSPKKVKAPKQEKKAKTTKVTKAKTPQKNNKRKRVAEVEEEEEEEENEESEEEEEEKPKRGAKKGAQKKGTGAKGGKKNVKRTLELTESPKKGKAGAKKGGAKSPAKKRRVK